MVLADYEATDEPGTLSVSKGEVVEIRDHAKNDWCLIRSFSRADTEGWIPAAFLTPYREIGRVGHVRSTSSPHSYSVSTSDSEELSGRSSSSPILMSPDALETYDSEEHRAEAEERRRWVPYRMLCSSWEAVRK